MKAVMKLTTREWTPRMKTSTEWIGTKSSTGKNLAAKSLKLEAM